MGDSKSKKKEDSILDQATAVLEGVQGEIADQVLYELEPKRCAEDIIINVEENPKLICRPAKPSVRLLMGDRAKGEYFRRLVSKERLEGLQLCYKLTKVHLQALEGTRRERIGEIVPEWVQEAHRLKREEENR